jgi:hypothetical protein
MTLQQRHVDVALAALVPLEEAGRGELDEIAQPLVAARQERQVVALVADRVGGQVVAEVGLEAQDRLDPVRLAGLLELHGAVHHAVVRQAQSGLVELGRARREGVDLAGAVEQRVLGVHVKMDRGRHVLHIKRGFGWNGGAEAAVCGVLSGRGRPAPRSA